MCYYSERPVLLKAAFKYTIGLFLVLLLLFKGTGILLTVFPSAFKNLLTAELLMETDQEKKGNSKTETAPDEWFEPLLLATVFQLIIPGSNRIIEKSQSLPNVYLDTSTPPPNTQSC